MEFYRALTYLNSIEKICRFRLMQFTLTFHLRAKQPEQSDDIKSGSRQSRQNFHINYEIADQIPTMPMAMTHVEATAFHGSPVEDKNGRLTQYTCVIH